MAFGGIAGAIGAYLQAKRQRALQDQQLQMQQQQYNAQDANAQAQIAIAQQRAAAEQQQLQMQQQQIVLQYRQNGLNPDGSPIHLAAPAASPGIAPGPGGPPQLKTTAVGPMPTSPSLSSLTSAPQAPTPTPPPAANTGAPPATTGALGSTEPTDGPTAWYAQAQHLQTQALGAIAQATDLDRQAKSASENGEDNVAARLQQEATGLRSQAQTYARMSDSIMTRAHQANQDALAFANAEERARHDRAEEGHWTAQEKQAAKAEADRTRDAIDKGKMTYALGMAHIAATYAGIDAANQRNAASIGAANERAAAGRAVTKRGQDLANQRGTATAAATASRGANSAAVKALQNNNVFTGLPPGVQSYISSSVQKNGVEKVNSALRAIATGQATDPNITQQQAQTAARVMGVQVPGQ